ncbi:protein MMS22-like [Dendronephthya gigantea]|uniref:protein MMS22-like n=1 Tax=Dendronephthya gigantea TaxID=151771 RepID=UPI00106BCE12|nr:protein MMS22-like [Dendronephthya gigantea]
MLNVDLSDYDESLADLTPPLGDIEKDCQEFGFDDDIIEVDKQLTSKRKKTEDFDEEFTPFLNCCNALNNLEGRQVPTRLQGSYFEHGFLSRLLQNESKKEDFFQKPIVKLFDYQFITASALFEQRQKLFYFLRQKIFEFENHASEQGLSSFMSGDNYWFYLNIRKQCCSFLLYVNEFIHRNLPSYVTSTETNELHQESWNFPSCLRKDVNNLWSGFIGPVSNLQNSSFLKFDGVNASGRSPAAQLLHLHLELRWGLIDILWQLYSAQNYDERCFDQLVEIEENVSALLKDLLHIATHIKRGSMPTSLLNTTPFLCACVMELWVIAIHFLDFLSTNHEVKSFWSALTMILNEEVLQREKDHEKKSSPDGSAINCKSPKAFCWWILVHVAPLYWYNVKGEYILREKAVVPGNWILVLDLLRLSFLAKDQQKVPEDLSRCYLSCCLQISQHWQPNNDVVLLLWDYFHKKMNEMFYAPNQKLQIGAYLRDTPPNEWLEQVLSRCNNPVMCSDNDTSFELFLKILALHLKKLKYTKTLQGWKQLKGRFYSRFHKKRMEELSEQGIMNFFDLFLTLACVGELQDVSNKMLSFLELLDFNSLKCEKKKCVWKGYFVLLFLYQSKEADAEGIVPKLADKFTDICRSYKDVCGQHNVTAKTLWSLISIFLENAQEPLEYRSDYNMIGEGFAILLPICNDKELQTLVNFIQATLSIISNKLQEGTKSTCAVLAQSLWDYVFPHIKQRITDPSLTSDCLSQLTNLVVGFTLLSIPLPPKGSSQTLETFDNLVQNFGLSDCTSASMSCQFLATLLTSPDALERFQSCNEFQTKLIHSWFRCALQISSRDQRLLNLTRIVFMKISQTGEIIKTQRSVVAGNVEAALTSLTRGLGETFSSLELLEETLAFREKALLIIGEFLKYIESFIKQGGPADCLRISYKVAASLVKDCAKIIYRKSQLDCQLPKMIDHLILPLSSTISPAITQCIKLNLTEFLAGMATLDFRRDEFIKRKIKQIYTRYFFKTNQEWYLSNHLTPKNPFVEVLKGTFCMNPSEDASDFRQFVINIIKENHLVVPGIFPQQLAPTLFFLVDLFKQTISPHETAKNTPLLLNKVLACVLNCDMSNPGTEPEHIRNKATESLELMLNSCQKAQDAISRESLLKLLKEFIFSNIHEVQGTIFKTLSTLSKFDKELVVSTLPLSKEAILNTERRRGVGTDIRLRTSFKTLVENLGIEMDVNEL